MSVTAFIRDLMSKGFTMEQALIAAESMEAVSAPRRSARQERNSRYYEAHKEELASKRRLKASETPDLSETPFPEGSSPTPPSPNPQPIPETGVAAQPR